MSDIRSFEDLLVWQRSIDLAVEVYNLTRSFPKEELFGLTSQHRRAAVSVSSKIAEGHGRGTRGEYIQFISIARGSNAEVRSQLLLSRRLNLGAEDQIRICLTHVVEVSKMLSALIQSLKFPLQP